MDFEADAGARAHGADRQVGPIAIAAEVAQHHALEMFAGFAQFADCDRGGHERDEAVPGH